MRGKKKGQALLEFAAVLGVTVMLTVGAIQSLYAFYLTRQVRAAAEEIADLAAVYGGDAVPPEEIALILDLHRLDSTRVEVDIVPAIVGYLDPFTLTLSYDVTIHFYGLFDLPIAAQRVRRLGEGG